MKISQISNIPFKSIQLDARIEVDFENKIITTNALSMYVLRQCLNDMWNNDSYAIKFTFPLHHQNCENWKFIFTDGDIFKS